MKMHLDKSKWKTTTLENCCDFIRGVTYSNKDEVDNYGYGILRANNIDLNNKLNLNNIKIISFDLIIKYEKKLKKNDIFICTASGSLEHVGKVAFVNLDTEYYAGGFMGIIRAKFDVIIPYFLFNIFLSPSLSNIIQKQRAGTNIQNLKFSDIANSKIPLPPLDEQEQIAELFQSIDTAIEQAEAQENRLKALQKKMTAGLLSEKPEFGKLLNTKNCVQICFQDFVDCIEQHDKQKKDVNRFIGLENIEPENFNITTWGNIADGTTFTKRFEKGDVLFGKRRAYLKKVAVAEFAGICSSDILVLRAKQNIILPELLQYYVSAEVFIQYAVSSSAGSLSPRTKWRDLSKFQISLPDLKIQKQILEVFQQLQLTSDKIKQQIATLKNLKQNLLNEIFS